MTQRESRVWCENPRHSRTAHKLVATGRYDNADSAARDPHECHYPHNADVPEGPEPIVGHPYTIHD